MKMVIILMMSAKLATLGLLKIEVLMKIEDYDVIIYVHHNLNFIKI